MVLQRYADPAVLREPVLCGAYDSAGAVSMKCGIMIDEYSPLSGDLHIY